MTSVEDHIAFATNHPDGRSRAHVFSTRLVKPLGACMMPVMIGALLGMLQEFRVLPFLYIGFPLAGLTAGIWTAVQLQRALVEIHFRDDAVAVRSLIAAAEPPEPLNWYRLLDVRLRRDDVRITVGYDLFTLLREEWRDFDDLKERLVQTLQHARDTRG